MQTWGQLTTGASGLLNIPEGEIHPDKTMSIGGNYLPLGQAGPKFDYDTGNYYFNLSFLPFIEATYRLTLIKSSNGRFTQQDRAFGLKYRIWKEKGIRPSFLVGMDDVYTHTDGNQYFASTFIASSKTLESMSDIVRVTLGYGFNTKGRNRLNGIFGGINYSPKCFTPLKLIAEFDTKKINFACSLLIAHHISIYTGYYGSHKMAAGLAWRFSLK